MHGELKLKALELIERGIIGSVNFMDDFLAGLSAPYGSSFRGMEYLVYQNRIRRARSEVQEDEKKKIYNLIYILKKEGLIDAGPVSEHKKLSLTKKGLAFLKNLRKRKQNSLPDSHYKVEKENTLKIVAFDIPEKEKRKRQWLRKVLKDLCFQMIQKSVWVGNGKIPTDFIDDLLKLRIFNYVEILSVSKSGTLKKFV